MPRATSLQHSKHAFKTQSRVSDLTCAAVFYARARSTQVHRFEHPRGISFGLNIRAVPGCCMQGNGNDFAACTQSRGTTTGKTEGCFQSLFFYHNTRCREGVESNAMPRIATNGASQPRGKMTNASLLFSGSLQFWCITKMQSSLLVRRGCHNEIRLAL